MAQQSDAQPQFLLCECTNRHSAQTGTAHKQAQRTNRHSAQTGTAHKRAQSTNGHSAQTGTVHKRAQRTNRHSAQTGSAHKRAQHMLSILKTTGVNGLYHLLICPPNQSSLVKSSDASAVRHVRIWSLSLIGPVCLLVSSLC